MRPATTQLRAAGPQPAAASAGCHAKRTRLQRQRASAHLGARQGQHAINPAGSALSSTSSAGPGARVDHVLSARRTQPYSSPAQDPAARTGLSAIPGENGASPVAGADTAPRPSPSRPAVSSTCAARACRGFVLQVRLVLPCVDLTLAACCACASSADCIMVVARHGRHACRVHPHPASAWPYLRSGSPLIRGIQVGSQVGSQQSPACRHQTARRRRSSSDGGRRSWSR